MHALVAAESESHDPVLPQSAELTYAAFAFLLVLVTLRAARPLDEA